MIATQFSTCRLAVAPASAKIASRASAVKVTAIFKKKAEPKPAVRTCINSSMWVDRARWARMRVDTGGFASHGSIWHLRLSSAKTLAGSTRVLCHCVFESI
jgi:hypothetical protein